MANRTIDMSKIRKTLELHAEGKSKRFIAKYLSLSRNTVTKYLNLYSLLSTDMVELGGMTDLELEALFQSSDYKQISPRTQSAHDFFPYMEKELKKKGTTKLGLWEEYKQKHPDGLQSTQFCKLYARWSKRTEPVMRIEHKAGDKLFVDYAGKTFDIVDPDTGEIKTAQFFVAILGASQYTYAEASESQAQESFAASLERALRYIGGVPQAIVPDNLKSAVVKTDRYEPVINPVADGFADHFETVILPARVRKPRDKAHAENMVKILYTRIHAPLRNKTFHSLEELNTAIAELLEKHNDKKLTARPYSRRELFEETERDMLKPLPLAPYQPKKQSLATVAKNCHVLLSEDKHYYSVPYRFMRKKVKLIYTKDTVEVFFKYNRIAVHKRNYRHYGYTTEADHLASTHRHITEWTPERLIEWGNNIGEPVGRYVSAIISERQHPEQAYHSCQGILRLAKQAGIGNERLIKACQRGLDIGGHHSYTVIKSILDQNMEEAPQQGEDDHTLPQHANIRGSGYYN